MTGSELRQDLIEELRELARRGEAAVRTYFKEALGLELPEAALVGGAFELEKGLRTREKLDAELTELIAKRRSRWDR